MRYFKNNEGHIFETSDELTRIVNVNGLYEKDEDGQLVETRDEFFDLKNQKPCYDAGGWMWGESKEYFDSDGEVVDLNDLLYAEVELWHDGHNFRMEVYTGREIIFGGETEYAEITDDMVFEELEKDCEFLGATEWKRYYKDADGNVFICHKSGSRDYIEQVKDLYRFVAELGPDFDVEDVRVEPGLCVVVRLYNNVYFAFVDRIERRI